MQFIIVHGAFSSPEGNWFLQLKEKLEALDQKVFLPRLPVDDWEKISNGAVPKKQSLTNWTNTFKKDVLSLLDRKEKICFVGHSLGPLFTLHLVDKFNLQLDSAIFVSPFLRKLVGGVWQINLVNKTFYKTDFNFEKLKRLIPISYVLYSNNDPYVDRKYCLEFAKELGSSIVSVTRAGHMNQEVNLNEFPLVLELCKTRLDLSLYQKYLAHRKELFAIDYRRNKTEEIIYIKPEEVFDEGVFHFRNLQRGGFCTFFTAMKFWDTQSVYMEEARKAAKRTNNFIRVFIINETSDLKRKQLLKQIQLDIDGGVKVYLCLYDKIKDQVIEPDFGIWDEDYLCTVHINKRWEMNKVTLSSRTIDIKQANNWKKIIMSQAVRIYTIKLDIDKFISSKSKISLPDN